MPLLFRKTLFSDLPQIMTIVQEAQNYFRTIGSDQWSNGYPSKELIKNDIATGSSYVLELDGKVAGFSALIFGSEPSYSKIYEGAWLTNLPYATLHRTAVKAELKGRNFASRILQECEKIALNRGISVLRADTHELNIPTQRVLVKNGFQYCGIVYLADEGKRLAYEKVIVSQV